MGLAQARPNYKLKPMWEKGILTPHNWIVYVQSRKTLETPTLYKTDKLRKSSMFGTHSSKETNVVKCLGPQYLDLLVHVLTCSLILRGRHFSEVLQVLKGVGSSEAS